MVSQTLASSLFIRVYCPLISSVNVCNFQVPMWALQSAETEIYSMHGSFVAAESPTHRVYWPFMGQCERMFCVTQQEDFNSTPTGRCCFKLFHYRGTNRRRSEVSENKCVQFHGEIPLAKLSLHSCSEIVLFPLLWWSRILFFQFDFLFLSSVIFFFTSGNYKFILKLDCQEMKLYCKK